MLVEFRVAQLLCSRLCHDLVGPAGAVNAGLELMNDDGVATDEALALVDLSAQQVTQRLAFYRLAFGFGGDSGGTSILADARKLIEGFLSGGKVSLDWPIDVSNDAERLVSGAMIKLLLNLALLGIDSLPGGGSLSVRFADLPDGMGIAMTASGNNARFNKDLQNAMNPNVSADELTVRVVHGYFSARLAEQLATSIEVSEGSDGSVRLAAVVPNQ